MAEMVWKNARIKVNGVALSTFVRSVTLTYSAELQDKTAMGSSGRKRIAGLKDWNASVEFNQDYTASKIDATLFPLVGASTFAVIIFNDATSTGAGHHKFNGAALLEGYSPIAGGVGDLATVSVNFQGCGTLTRTTL